MKKYKCSEGEITFANNVHHYRAVKSFLSCTPQLRVAVIEKHIENVIVYIQFVVNAIAED